MSERPKLSDFSEKYYDDCQIIDCHGDKCRLEASDGFGIHCIACNPSLKKMRKEGRLNEMPGRCVFLTRMELDILEAIREGTCVCKQIKN